MTKISKILPPSVPIPRTPEEKRDFGQLYGLGLAYTLATLARDSDSMVLALVKDAGTAAKLERELKFLVESHYPIFTFPDWEILPYDVFSPHQDIISERLRILYQLSELKRGLVLIPVSTAMHQLCPKEYLIQNSFIVEKGMTLDRENLRKNLVEAGYQSVSEVNIHGEFAVRGSILDLFPMGATKPYRIDFFDQEIDSIRGFNVETQRSEEKMEEVHLLPANEFPLTPDSISYFRSRFRDQFEGDPRHCSLYLHVSEGHRSPGVEYYLPLFFEKTALIFDYLPDNCLIAEIEEIKENADLFWNQVKSRYEQYRHDRFRPILEPKQITIPSDELFAAIKKFRSCYLTPKTLPKRAGSENFPFNQLPDLSEIKPSDTTPSKSAANTSPLQNLQNFLNDFNGRVLLTAESLGRKEVIKELLGDAIHLVDLHSFQEFIESDFKFALSVAPIDEGMIWDSIAIIPEALLFGKRVMQRRLRKQKAVDFDFELRSLAELSIGDPVVHLDYGIGRYLGLTLLKLSSQEGEFLSLEYAGGDKLYIPVTSLHLVSRYSGVDTEHAPLSKLGSGQWEKIKSKVLEQTRDIAAELLELYAKREAKQRDPFSKIDDEYQSFSSEFAFEETPDQARAIHEVIKDLTSRKPMDRVICGDVGFGKTEVALRAAFLAVKANKQAAVLVPTTLLAEQHFNTFRDRFANFPIRIEVISRFKTRKEQDQIVQDLEAGKIDIIIGTHKLLQEEVKFKNLGLLIIDEEHRFGVRQKETFKRFRAEVDILTLTATPIPRTLNMAMSGMRDLSIIATPPLKRLSVKTFVRERSPMLIQEAIQRELYRGGQVYYLHNEVDTIENVAHELQNLLPNCRIAIAHGQMREKELEKVMSEFYHQYYSVLVCTTIIETGIDIPTANTIIIDRADKFGLAQLHQLRGRVGRSHHQAYAFCLVPKEVKISTDAKKRLEAIESLDQLGVGFTLATHDLEIRGAGELLGEEQSGNIQSVGFPLFMELLDHAVKLLKQDKDPVLASAAFKKEFKIDLQIPAFIPESYLPDVNSRLLLYKRIANGKHKEALKDLMVEMIDRFGPLPLQTRNLFTITEIKLKALPLGIIKIDAGPKGGLIEFEAKPAVDPNNIIRLIQDKSGKYRLEGPQKLRIQETLSSADQRMQAVVEWLAFLGSPTH